jgi:rubredoxin
MRGLSNLGRSEIADDSARYECKICWHVYDPATGDSAWQIDSGTPFSVLPQHWSCPACCAPKADFLLLRE